MARKFDIKGMVLGGLLGASPMFSVAAVTTPKPTWDYKMISGHLRLEPRLAPPLDQAAADGWEVVSAASCEGGPFVILRRAK
jgi:hypothetical protein